MRAVNDVYGKSSLQQLSWLQKFRARVIKAAESLFRNDQTSDVDSDQVVYGWQTTAPSLTVLICS